MLKISKAIIIKDSKYLLLKRAPISASFPDLWDFAGGKHDLNETSVDSVIRETKEETSFDIKPGEIEKELEYHDEKFDLIFYFFNIKSYSGNLKLSTDHIEYLWLSKEEIKKYKLHPSVKLYFNL